MQKILIIGSPGSGKSTLARRLRELTGLELIHLDQHYWREGWANPEPEAEVWREIVRELIARPEWIMDGNYGGTFDIRFPEADTIVFLDFPTLVTLWRVIKRTLRYHGKARPDMPEGCPERFDISFLIYVVKFRKSRRAGILEKLQALRPNQGVVHIRNRKSLDAFLESVASRRE